jgi:hypothetical protein
VRQVALLALVASCATAPSPLNVNPLPTLPQVRAPVRVSGAGELVLKCTPTDAEVALDGVTQGLCTDFGGEPRGLRVGRTARHVAVKKSGFVTWETWLAADETRVVMTVTLTPNGGSR